MSRHNAGDESMVAVADDADIFLGLLHHRYHGSLQAGHVYMESPKKERTAIDIDATVEKHTPIIPDLVAAHNISGSDNVASFYGIGKATVLKVLREGISHPFIL